MNTCFTRNLVTLEELSSPRRPRLVHIAPPVRLRNTRLAGRRLVARGGFEPPKPLGRQIYSLLRLTAPQPRQCWWPVSEVRRHSAADVSRQEQRSAIRLADSNTAGMLPPCAFGQPYTASISAPPVRLCTRKTGHSTIDDGQITSTARCNHSRRNMSSQHRRAETEPYTYPVAASSVPRPGHHQPVATRDTLWRHRMARIRPPDPEVGGLVRDDGSIASPRSRTGPRRPGHSPVAWKHSLGAGEGIRTPDPLITNQLLYLTELRQPDQSKSLAQPMPQRQEDRPLGHWTIAGAPHHRDGV